MAAWRLQWPHTRPGHMPCYGATTQSASAHSGAVLPMPVSVQAPSPAPSPAPVSAASSNHLSQSSLHCASSGVPALHRAYDSPSGSRHWRRTSASPRPQAPRAVGCWPSEAGSSPLCRASRGIHTSARESVPSRATVQWGYRDTLLRGAPGEGKARKGVPGHMHGEHGAVVLSGTGSRGQGPNAPSEEESEELAIALAVAASDTKAGDIRVLDVRPIVYWTQYFVIATAFSRPQMDALAKRISDLAETQYGRALCAGERKAPGPWTLMDYGDVVVHLFSPREREQYAIEGFYANAKDVSLPFLQGEASQL